MKIIPNTITKIEKSYIIYINTNIYFLKIGIKIIKINSTKLPSETLPLLMYSGELTLSSTSNKLMQITLSSHEDIGNIVEYTKMKEILENQILCRR